MICKTDTFAKNLLICIFREAKNNKTLNKEQGFWGLKLTTSFFLKNIQMILEVSFKILHMWFLKINVGH